MGIFSTLFTKKGLAIDLGTVNTVIAKQDVGIVLKEPSIVAVSTGPERTLLAVGSGIPLSNAPLCMKIVSPMKEGGVCDAPLAGQMLTGFIHKALGHRPGMLGINAVICVPGCTTEIERTAIIAAARSAGVRRALILDEALAAAVGANMPVSECRGSMVVDIGGGTTDAAVVSLNGIAASTSIRTGGTHINEAIILRIKNRFGISIGEKTAEELKQEIGLKPDADASVYVRGRRMSTGLPDGIEIPCSEVAAAIGEPLCKIVDAVLETLAKTPPELSGDIIDTGIMLTGGGALLKGLDERIRLATGIDTYVADSCMDCVVLGALRMLEYPMKSLYAAADEHPLSDSFKYASVE